MVDDDEDTDMEAAAVSHVLGDVDPNVPPLGYTVGK